MSALSHLIALPTQSWLTRPIPIKSLLDLHNTHLAPDGIVACIGDGYLCLNNTLYRHVRRLFRSFRFSYSTEPTRLFIDYAALPLLMIPDLISNRVVPVTNNTNVLERLITNNSTLAITSSALVSVVRKNYLLHESAHCVSYNVLSPILGRSPSDGKRLYVLLCLLCEAYANAVERIASLEATSEEHRLLFALNSYCLPSTSILGRECRRALPLTHLLLLGIVVFLIVNCNLEWTGKEFDAFVSYLPRDTEAADMSDKQKLLAQLLAETLSADLNKTFIRGTNRLFFRYIDCEAEYMEMCSTGPLSTMTGEVLEHVLLLATMTCSGSMSAFAASTCPSILLGRSVT